MQLGRQPLASVCASEAAFMQLLWGFGVDQQYCHQVVPGFWSWPVDFYNYHAGFYVEVDGRHHWTGMHQYSQADIAQLDMRLNLAVISARKPLVRVLLPDIQNPSAVLAALQAAMNGAAIVLTPAYAQLSIVWQGKQLLYTEALRECAGNAGVQLTYIRVLLA